MSEDEAINQANTLLKAMKNASERNLNSILFEAVITRSDIKAIETILDLYNKEKEDNKLYKLGIIQDQDFKDRLIEILGVGDNEETILQYIATLVSENARLEDIEDRKVQIEYELVFNKGVKSFEDKIRAKIKELENKKEYCLTIWVRDEIRDFQELLEEEQYVKNKR